MRDLAGSPNRWADTGRQQYFIKCCARCQLVGVFNNISMNTTRSPQAQRILETLYTMAKGSGRVAVSFDEIAKAAQVSRTYVATAIRELKQTAQVIQIKGFGTKAEYILPHDASFAVVRTSAHYCAVVRTSAPDECTDDNCDDERSCAFEKLCRLLSEFNIKEPVRSQLAKLLETQIEREHEIRAICERTKHESVWRNKQGVMVKRLRAFALGLQDPLPIFDSAFASQSASQVSQMSAPRHAERNRRMNGRTFLRPQVVYTEEKRLMAREKAAHRIRERRQHAVGE